MTLAEQPSDWLAHFQLLDAWLHQHQALWRPKPFTVLHLNWEAELPELAQWLRAGTLEQAEAAHNQPQYLNAPEPFPQLARQALALSRLPDLRAEVSAAAPELLSRHIPGRKWQQITHFADTLSSYWNKPSSHWLDWCAGKGHLGRLLAWRGAQPLLCLERDTALNQEGARLGQLSGITSQHLDVDVLTQTAWQHLRPEHSVVALHACGQLHMTLLEQAAQQQCRQLAISPCCYNRIATESYQPLSSAARHAELQLSRDDLSLPMQASVTAGQRHRRLRDKSMACRLAFDLWQRQARNCNAYLPTPSRPESAMQLNVRDFCLSLAAHHGLQLPEPADWAALEQQGWQRLAQVRNLELLRGLFRRPLEIWLLLDRALYLQEAGYRVQVGEFCDYQLTPRNFLLIAEK